MTIGIYKIENVIDSKVYIGLSRNVEKRLRHHTYRLLDGKHPNEHLRSAWAQHGESAFTFTLIEECDIADLESRERYWINEYKSSVREFGYNKTIGGRFGRMSDEIIARTTAILKTKTISAKQRERISATLTGKSRPNQIKFSRDIENQIIVDFSELRIGVKALAAKYNVSTTCIYNIFKRNNIHWRKNESSITRNM